MEKDLTSHLPSVGSQASSSDSRGNAPLTLDTPSIQNALRLAGLGVVTNLGLAALKIAVGLLGHSYALIADGIESTTDAVTSSVVWIGLRLSLRPADSSHPYGHGKAESLAGLMVALALIAAAVAIAVGGINRIMHPGEHAPKWFVLPVLGLIIVVKELLARRVKSAGETLKSSSLMGEAWHHRSDAMSSLAAFVGVGIAIFGGPTYRSADAIAALAASVIIGINGIALAGPAFNEIMDAAPPEDLIEKTRKLAARVDDVVGIDKCRIRKSGLEYYVDIHVIVDGDASVRTGHRIAHQVKDSLIASDENIVDVDVHIEPTPKGWV
ncbi:cation diffusion facilitator family transporter [Verrucomicrobium sp. GAS474]|uniref:cation diffusion facilitator family transporter n=1 Tax=Verrucomicrobium sp. GAS474 TaxID=1882831 RepID=UPI00087CACE7|nr:cation diffusion facilitator family transporter [Verrucomicrobium sp. GAS474]SDU26551.1 cation diffusion facilitator family transporter [Verrucomicrobium sp. GAS474]